MAHLGCAWEDRHRDLQNYKWQINHVIECMHVSEGEYTYWLDT